MVWVRLDDHFDENPKIASVGPLGIALWVTGLAYCNRNLTDGFIPGPVAVRMLSLEFEYDGEARSALVGGERSYDGDQSGFIPDGHYVPNLLVAAGLWENVPGGYQVHDYGQFQPTKAEIEAERAAKQDAGRAGGKASAQARAQAKSKQVLKQVVEHPGKHLLEIQAPAQAPAQADAQAKSKPDPDPDPVNTPVGPLSGSDGGDDDGCIDNGFRERFGTLATALGGNLSGKTAREFQDIAEDFSQSDIDAALKRCTLDNVRPYPNRVVERLPKPEPTPLRPPGIQDAFEAMRIRMERMRTEDPAEYERINGPGTAVQA